VTAVDHRAALQADYEARLGPWSDIQQHLPELRSSAACYPAGAVLELGVRWGTSTAALLAGVAQAGGHLWSVDIVPPTVSGWWASTGLWTLSIGDDLDPAVAARQPPELDVLFIDTSHVYEQTLGELRTYAPRVAPGGLILCHDTELEAPEAAAGAGPPYPVARALDAYCADVGWSWTNRVGCYGLGVIEVPA
jgi:predicted O-methyltransferase YrrM